MGAINWPNVSVILKPFKPADDKTNYSQVPAFKQTGGYIAGTQPDSGHTVAPSPLTPQLQQMIDNLPDVFTIFHR
jgi:hypothetical protein